MLLLSKCPLEGACCQARRDLVFRQSKALLGFVMLLQENHERISGKPIIPLPPREVQTLELEFSKLWLPVLPITETNCRRADEKDCGQFGNSKSNDELVLGPPPFMTGLQPPQAVQLVIKIRIYIFRRWTRWRWDSYEHENFVQKTELVRAKWSPHRSRSWKYKGASMPLLQLCTRTWGIYHEMCTFILYWGLFDVVPGGWLVPFVPDQSWWWRWSHFRAGTWCLTLWTSRKGLFQNLHEDSRWLCSNCDVCVVMLIMMHFYGHAIDVRLDGVNCVRKFW